MERRIKVGLTGGIGCGKSTVLRMLSGLGWRVVETDALAKGLLAEDAGVIAAVKGEFGERICDKEGRIDRAALAGIVFGESEKLRRLERILHPPVRALWQAALRESGPVVIEIPLLFERQLAGHFPITVCVACAEGTQMRRLRARGWNRDMIEARLGQQYTLKEKREKADITIHNDGALQHLEAQVKALKGVAGALLGTTGTKHERDRI